jgi:transcriptional regulator with XRE-family HTH domain
MKAEAIGTQNLVKQTCKELGITQKELAERLGIKEVTINKWSSSGEVPLQGSKAIGLLLENEKMKKDLHIVELFKNYIKDS